MNPVTAAEVREFLVYYFDGKAGFREWLAERAKKRNRPSDVAKNEACASSLRQLARYISDLPDDNSTLQALADCSALYDEASEMIDLPSDPKGPPGLPDQADIHYGSRGEEMEAAELGKWFAAWTEALIGEAELLRANREGNSADQD